MLGASISKNSLLLAVFALIAAGGLALTNESTKERIQKAERAAQQKALFEIVPRSRHDNDLLLDTVPVPENAWHLLGLKKGGDIHIARQNGQVVAMIIPAVAPDGYSGDIRMIVGINRDGSVAGVRVLAHNETPGLGDKVDLKKSDWILSFNGKSLAAPAPADWAVKKDGGDFDQFTGATITPRAVVNQVRRVLEFVEAEDEILSLGAKAETTGGDTAAETPTSQEHPHE
ncbi:MAG TPA: electron transport complex subunit RsxG [Cellvibrio sp.]|nr:electron transport complex subunit RsxG [Cellvibrio sp.]